ncbi:MAG: class I SAM-dependent methyltransferase, partial [Nanoarchaeota archaeon]
DYIMSTDDFFNKLRITNTCKKFDVIYIDACHEANQAIRDFNNSIDFLASNGYIFLHDLIPPDENHIKQEFCGNSYKILYYLWTHFNHFRFYPLDIKEGNYGLTVFIHPIDKLVILDEYVSYGEFKETLTNHMLYSMERLKEIVRNS